MPTGEAQRAIQIAIAWAGAYISMAWKVEDLAWLGIDEASSGGDIITARIGTPLGEIRIMAEVEIASETGTGRWLLMLRGAHIESDAGPNTIGIADLRVVAALILREVDCHEARVEGATRTTGANPGHTPRSLRFARRRNTTGGG